MSHEYFHLWNVKRMKPAVFTPYDLDGESYTGLLWVFEGITSYYDDLALLRSGLIDARSYLELLGQIMTRVERGEGRRRQTVEESSFDAWIKFYKQDANGPNAVVSYYTKGALIALALDLKLREETAGKVTLDDVMGECWTRFGETGVGMQEREFEAVCSELAGSSFSDFFDAAVRGTHDLPLDGLLERTGVNVHRRASDGARDKGGLASAKSIEVWFGAAIKAGGGRPIVRTVASDSPAEKAGLQPGDELIAFDRLRVRAGGIDGLLRRYRVRDKVELIVSRGDVIHTLDLVFEAAPKDTVYLELVEEPGEEARRRRLAFLNA